MTASCSPVLLMLFNRPDISKQLIQIVHDARPSALFVAADGPRADHLEDLESCRQTRSLVDLHDWACPVHKLYRGENLGLQRAVISAIDWFFEHVDSGIILEDDCLPSADFFPFCSELLHHYADNQTVMHISGLNMRALETFSPHSYLFTSVGHIWGWATWRRAWSLFDSNLSDWPTVAQRFTQHQQALHRVMSRKFASAYAKRKPTWSRAWYYSVMRHSGVAVVPCVNMIRNVGFGGDATHTRSSKHPLAVAQLGVMHQPLIHPLEMTSNNRYECLLTEYHKGSYLRQVSDMWYRALSYARKLFRGR